MSSIPYIFLLDNEFAGEAKRTDLATEQDVVELVREIRKERLEH